MLPEEAERKIASNLGIECSLVGGMINEVTVSCQKIHLISECFDPYMYFYLEREVLGCIKKRNCERNIYIFSEILVW